MNNKFMAYLVGLHLLDSCPEQPEPSKTPYSKFFRIRMVMRSGEGYSAIREATLGLLPTRSSHLGYKISLIVRVKLPILCHRTTPPSPCTPPSGFEVLLAMSLSLVLGAWSSANPRGRCHSRGVVLL